MKSKKLSYQQAGVNYQTMDPIKKFAQDRARQTANNLKPFSEMTESRGESAYVWDEGNNYKAFVIEGLGTKNRVADAMEQITGKTYYDAIAQDTVAMIVNDLIVVGAAPLVVNAYFAVGNSNWFSDKKRARALITGWGNACDLAGATWGGGETPTLKGIVSEDTIDLAGSAIGTISPKNRLTLGNKLQAGDRIVFIESSGIHANGLTLARAVAEKLPKKYQTTLPNGTLYGEALLNPTHIYAKLVRDLFDNNIDIHYMVNITGHGWRKLMRATQQFSYVIESIPEPQEEYTLIQETSGNSDEEMYGNFNMGAGFAVFLPEKDAAKAQAIIKKNQFESLNAGYVEKGPKRILIKPKQITYTAESLDLR